MPKHFSEDIELCPSATYPISGKPSKRSPRVSSSAGDEKAADTVAEKA